MTGGLAGRLSDVEIHAREIVDQKRRMNELYSQRTGQDFEKIERDTDRDYMLGTRGSGRIRRHRQGRQPAWKTVIEAGN